MNSRREQIWVGMFVLVATGILVWVVLTVSGTFSKKGVGHRVYFKYANGLAQGALVRFGGLQAGRVEAIRVDPQDPTRIEIEFIIGNEIPLKTDSVGKITTLGLLGESYLELTTGTRNAPPAPAGSVIQAQELLVLSDITEKIGGLVPVAEQTLQNLNQLLIEAKGVLPHVNDLLGDQNRKNIRSGLATLNAMLTETRPKIAVTLDNVQAASGKLQPVLANVQTASDKIVPLLDDVKATLKLANETLSHVDGMVVENRPDVTAVVGNLRKVLDSTSAVIEAIKNTMDHNTDNLDETLENVRVTTENLTQMTDGLKRKPSLLIRGENGKDRKPGEKK